MSVPRRALYVERVEIFELDSRDARPACSGPFCARTTRDTLTKNERGRIEFNAHVTRSEALT